MSSSSPCIPGGQSSQAQQILKQKDTDDVSFKKFVLMCICFPFSFQAFLNSWTEASWELAAAATVKSWSVSIWGSWPANLNSDALCRLICAMRTLMWAHDKLSFIVIMEFVIVCHICAVGETFGFTWLCRKLKYARVLGAFFFFLKEINLHCVSSFNQAFKERNEAERNIVTQTRMLECSLKGVLSEFSLKKFMKGRHWEDLRRVSVSHSK